MHRLISGIRSFRANVFPARQSQFEELAFGQQPSALFITCSDSRIVPQMLMQTEPGELFILRNAGNLVPPCTAAPSGEAATIEYAVQVLKVEDIIVCGHSHCGAISGLLRPESLAGLPAVEHWLKYAEQVRREIAAEALAPTPGDDLLTTAVKTNVLVQLSHLRTYPAIAAKEANGELRLHGCFYRFETGEVTVLDGAQRMFVSIDDAIGAGLAATA